MSRPADGDSSENRESMTAQSQSSAPLSQQQSLTQQGSDEEDEDDDTVYDESSESNTHTILYDSHSFMFSFLLCS